MKIVFTIISAVFLCTTIWAQVPEGMTYQAVVRDSDDNLATNSAIGMQISILQTSIAGAAVYVERQFPTTNANGLVSIEIGGAGATVLSGDLSEIDWGSGPYFIKTETDLNGGANYTISGTSQLLSVPYALHAKTAESAENITITGDETAFDGWDKDESDDFDGQYSSLEGSPSNVSDFTNDSGYITDPADNDNSSTNEIQSLSIEGSSLSISDGNSVALDDIIGNKTISFPASAISISTTGGVITEHNEGLRWARGSSGYGRITIKKPSNYNGGSVTVTIFFRTTTSTFGNVDFEVRPRSFNAYDGYSNGTDQNGAAVGVSGTISIGTLYEQSITMVGGLFSRDWWSFVIKRVGPSSTYLDDVILWSVAISY